MSRLDRLFNDTILIAREFHWSKHEIEGLTCRERRQFAEAILKIYQEQIRRDKELQEELERKTAHPSFNPASPGSAASQSTTPR